MPEGDTIHKLASRLRNALAAHPVLEVRIDGSPVGKLEGREISEIQAVGKHLLIEFGELTLRTHLGMYGVWFQRQPNQPARRGRPDSVRLECRSTSFHCRNAKEVELMKTGGRRYREFLHRLGPDLIDAPDLDAVLQRVARTEPTRPMVDVLLDQRISSGIGNVYKSEALFLAQIHPMAPLQHVAPNRVREVFSIAIDLLGANLRGGPRRTRRPGPTARAEVSADDPGLWVYGRAGSPCLLCGTTIEFARLGQHLRGTWWCSHCQPEAGHLPAE